MLYKLIIILWLLVASPVWAANWYVDNAASGSNNGTSWTNAWQSFATIGWASVAPGDTVYISGGTTTKTYSATSLSVGNSGTSGNPITIKAGQDVGHNGVVFISTRQIYLGYRDYITVDGEYNGERHIKVTPSAGGTGVEAIGADHFILRYIEVQTATKGISATYGIGGRISYCYLYDIREEAGIQLNARNWADPIVNEYDQTLIDHNLIQLNRTPTGGVGPDGIQGAWGTTIEYNIFTSVVGTTTGAQHQDYIQMQTNYLTIRGNAFISSDDSAIDYDAWNGQPHHHKIYNNVFIMPVGGGIRYYASGGASVTSLNDIYIANNTFVDHTSGHQWALSATNFNGNPTVSNVFIKNNIFFNCISPVYISASSGFTQADWNFDYNLVNSGSVGNTYVTLDGSLYTQTNPRTATPSFVAYTPDSESSDLHLFSADTAAKNNGTSLSSYFTTDKDGINRPQGSVWDIGAYEYVVSSTPGPSKLNRRNSDFNGGFQ